MFKRSKIQKDEKKMSKNTAYSLVPDPEHPDADYWCICLDEGEFRGTIYKYGPIRIPTEVNEDESIHVRFEYDILYLPAELAMKEFGDEKKGEFENLLGTIMMEMVQADIEAQTTSTEEEHVGTTGSNDTEKFIVRRSIHTKSDSFSKR